MEITENFFQLFYNQSDKNYMPNDIELIIDSTKTKNLAPEAKSIILSVNESNFALYASTNSFQSIYNTCILQEQEMTIENIKMIQGYILQNIQINELYDLKNYIFRLSAADIITNTYARNFINFLNVSISKTRKDSKLQAQKLDLQTLVAELESIYARFLELELNKSIYLKLNNILNNMKNQKFSIGITGVLSAGKSTFLNALLGKEILGSSTIPETANLTILKYGDKNCAKVRFWNQKEWQELKDLAESDTSLKDFILQSEKKFGDSLNNYITKESRTQDISLDELNIFTSANHESKLCNLVKEIELQTDLKFLQNGVEIVDTPGLDDPVTKREEITKAYIQKCDVLIHAMNASCAATQIDIDFIIESLVEQNISRLLVVLTRADLIGEKELHQSLEYTKSSLSIQLKKSNYKGDIESLLTRIDFIPIASFLALLHKTNRGNEALAQGYTLEKTGILDVEQYLDKILLGENSLKHKDILYLAYRAFLKVASLAQEEVALESQILNASNEELEIMLDSLKKSNEDLLKSLEDKQRELQIKADELQEFLQISENIIRKHLKIEQEKLKSRIYHDAIYGYANNKIPTKQHICEVLDQALHDCFVDTSRDYKQKISEKIMQLLSNQDMKNIESISNDLSSTNNHKIAKVIQPKISIQASKEQIHKSLALLQSSVPELINKHSASTQNELAIQMDSVFDESFSLFYEAISKKSNEISQAFSTYFTQLSKQQQEYIKLQIADKEESLTQMLDQRKKANSQNLRDSLIKKQKELQSLINQLEYISQSLSSI
ncbi:hypothetical protein LS73_002575 [Helicobacter muridarum]|uniref:Putative ATP/GTP binding protein n=1 Tax=Helicobacter muridarum TaxID=216 RepID=A0A099TZ04_9HELI|nr:dynamin family protein [Helicobacter muridarum]TLE01173.1 hypothetical protein LS73_002575 [Helicobacter muridarum]STQ86049.1 putative ATP/GTP binding protein [Helicobacter muridarum]